jgi:hypothetical protein
MNKNQLIIVRTFSNELDAQIALEHLKSHHIDAFIKKDDSGGMRPHLQLSQGVDIIVSEKDAKKAEEILVAMKV